MEERKSPLATRLKALREIEGKTAEELAGEVGIGAADYAAFEAGTEEMPAGLLHGVARALAVDPADLLSGESPRMRIFSVTRKGRGMAAERRREYRYQSLGANFAGRRMEVFEVTVPPDAGAAGARADSHAGQEFVYVLEGRLAVDIQGNELVLEAGDSVYFDAAHGHAMRALDGKPARFLAAIA